MTLARLEAFVQHINLAESTRLAWRCPDCGRAWAAHVLACAFCWSKADEARGR